MDAWVIWLIVAVVFAVAEVINLSFYLFPFAIGAAGDFLERAALSGDAAKALEQRSRIAVGCRCNPACCTQPEDELATLPIREIESNVQRGAGIESGAKPVR